MWGVMNVVGFSGGGVTSPDISVLQRQRPVCEQRGAVQCSVCDRLGGLAVHHCGK